MRTRASVFVLVAWLLSALLASSIAIVALKAGGQSWAQIARAHKVSLKGSTELLREMMKN